MTITSAIFVIIFCAVASFFLYGMWAVENDRYEFKKKHGIDPKYHGWVVEEDNDTKDKDQ